MIDIMGFLFRDEVKIILYKEKLIKIFFKMNKLNEIVKRKLKLRQLKE
jgi:hypothetical protein